MTTEDPTETAGHDVEAQIDAWREHLRARRQISGPDVDELEDHLREQIASLTAQGLASDEAFLVAVKRIGAIDALTREFAREQAARPRRHRPGAHQHRGLLH